MTSMKNIHVESDFKDRTGLIIKISNRRMVKRLMKYGLLHYFSNKMRYALLYVDTNKLDQMIEKIKKEKFVNSIELSKLRNLPIEYDGILEKLNKEIVNEKKEKKQSIFSNPLNIK